MLCGMVVFEVIFNGRQAAHSSSMHVHSYVDRLCEDIRSPSIWTQP